MPGVSAGHVSRTCLIMKILLPTRKTIVLLLLCTGWLRAQEEAVRHGDEPVYATANPAVAIALAFAQQPTGTTAGMPVSPSVTIQLKDNAGKNLAQAGVAVTLVLSSGSGTLSGTTTRATTALGLATFDSLSINLIGTKQLRATATGFQSATSSSFTIALGPPALLLIQTEPSASATAGSPFAQQPVLWVEDKGGNRVTTDNSTVVTAARLEGAGTLQGILTATAINGIVTFSNLSHNVADTISVLFRGGTLTPDTSRNILILPAAAARLAFLQQPTSTPAGAPVTPAVTVTLMDAFGNPVRTTGTSVTVSLATGTGALNGTLTKSTVSGTATFNNLSINSTGTKSLRAASGTLTAAVSNTFSITPGQTKTLVFVQQPTGAQASSAISPAVTIQVRDSLGNNVPAPGLPVTLALASGNGTLGGTTVRATDSTGLATFGDLNINLIGSKTLSASSPSLTTAISTAFTIVAGTAGKLLFVQQPTGTRAGVAITPAVTVQLTDAQGNNVRTAGIPVAVVMSSGTGTLSGTVSQLTDVGGLATFNNLTINLSGAKRLGASASGLTAATSDLFSISAATASKLAFTTNPGGGIAGTPFATQPVVTLEDAFGNPATNTSQTVTLTLQNNAGTGGTLSGARSLAVDLATGRATFSGLSIDRMGTGYTLTATGSTVSTTPGTVVSLPFSIGAGAATKVRVENAPDGSGTPLVSQNVSSGTSISLYAIARDAYDNFVANVPADTWALGNTTGGVVPADLVPNPDRSIATFTARLTGSTAISAIKASLTSIPSGTLTVVVAGSPSQIRVESAANGTGTLIADRNIVSGSTFTMYAIGRDAAGNFISNIAPESWSLQNKTGGIVDGDLAVSGDKKNAAFTGKLLGTTRVRATLGSLATANSGVLSVVAGPATAITATAGTAQNTPAGTAFPEKLAARVNDAMGNPIKGLAVSWTAPVSGASGTFAAEGAVATTDSNGIARSGVFTANTIAGSYAVVASLPMNVDTATYSLTNTVGAAARIVATAGSPQSVMVTKQYPVALEAVVTDSSGNASGGVSVTFTAPQTGPGGSFTGGGRTAVVATSPAGIARAPAFFANSTAGSYQVVATTAGVPSGAIFELRNTAGASGSVAVAAGSPQSVTVGYPFTNSLSANVTDSSGNALPGIQVRFVAPSTGPGGRFARGLVDSALTDASGTATSSTLTANTLAGSFTVLALVNGVSTPAAFQMTNQPGQVDTFLVDAAGGGTIPTQIAQVPFNIRVRANDQYGNTSASFNGTAGISSNGVILQAGTSTAPFVSGILASHTVAMQHAGRFIVMATRSGGAETGRTDTFAVVNPAPTVTKIAPALGRRGQNLTVAVFGSGFIPGVTTVSLGDLISTSTSVVTSTEMAVTISIDTAATIGIRDLYVFNGPPGGGIGTLAAAFGVSNNPSPRLASITPDSGTVLQRLSLVLTGNNFMSDITRLHMGPGISVESIACTSLTHLSATISIAGSASGGLRQIFVSNSAPGGGNSDTLSFRVAAPPTPFPVLASPADGAYGYDTTMTLRWYPWLDAGVRYWLQVATSPSFDTLIVDDSTFDGTSAQITSLVRGMTYFWRVLARNPVGSSAPSPTRSFTVGFVYAATLSVADTIGFPSHASRAEYRSADFRLVGLPGNCNVPGQILLRGTYEVDWVAYWDNGAQTNYLVPFDGTATFSFLPGRAFWILNRGPLTITASVPSLPLDSLRSVAIPLHPGWNLITNPFLSTVQWAAVQNLNSPNAVPDIWAFTGSFSRSPAFESCVGYLFDNTDNRTALRIPLGSTARKNSSHDVDDVLWRIHIELLSEGRVDRATSIGVSPTAKCGRDPLDLRMPRGIGQEPGVFFSRPGWDQGGSAFATDIRTEIDGLETWPVSVRSAVRKPAQLSFSGIPDVPAQFQVLLIDDERGRCVNLRTNPVYGFVPEIPLSQFRVVVGSDEAVRQVLTDLLPKEFALGSNFPNPFNPSTTIPVAIPRYSTMVLSVYTILGEEVRRMFEGVAEPGYRRFVWDGCNARGQTVSSGVYLIRLTTDGGQSFTGKMLLMR